LMWIRKRLLRTREITLSETWGCGYLDPNPRMQYTGSSFARFFMDSAKAFLRPFIRLREPRGYFPAAGHFESHVQEPVNGIIHVLFDWLKKPLTALQTLQQGRLPVYVLYIAVTLLLLLLWYGGQQ
jgi:hydrogenase-4 component B